jgi:hypothetical protein
MNNLRRELWMILVALPFAFLYFGRSNLKRWSGKVMLSKSVVLYFIIVYCIGRSID